MWAGALLQTVPTLEVLANFTHGDSAKSSGAGCSESFDDSHHLNYFVDVSALGFRVLMRVGRSHCCDLSVCNGDYG